MIYYIIGIRRSGLHAIANWLFPMMGEFIYLNNYELGKLTDIEMVIKGNFNVLIGIENKPLDQILKYCDKGKRIFIMRRPSDIILSQEKWYRENNANVDEKLRETNSLIEQYYSIWKNREEFIITYELWDFDIKYRKIYAKELGLQFNDINKEKIFGYGKSSFSS